MIVAYYVLLVSVSLVRIWYSWCWHAAEQRFSGAQIAGNDLREKYKANVKKIDLESPEYARLAAKYNRAADFEELLQSRKDKVFNRYDWWHKASETIVKAKGRQLPYFAGVMDTAGILWLAANAHEVLAVTGLEEVWAEVMASGIMSP